MMDDKPGLSRGLWDSLIIYLVGVLTGCIIGIVVGVALW